ncbi:ATP-binding protein [Micromonospora sp. NPDC005172]|uniref:ATP-binding protein n=1 Tax=Micromonospora sp. NPDC005172 TaxID=3156867 RepID=UPI0033AE39D9
MPVPRQTCAGTSALPSRTTPPVIELIFERLAAADVPTETAELVLAALTSEEELDAALAGAPVRLDPRSPTGGDSAEHIWLKSVTVAGFRGVGPERTLQVDPGPGLTLVVGRNESGKSSFAEAVELALTGDSARWADKTSVWRTGWRNLHNPDPCWVDVELRVDGVATPTRVHRAWPVDAGLTDAEVTVTSAHGRHGGLDELGLGRPLELYRPFLTAAELGKLASGTQSQLFDALFAILGLDALTDADQRLLCAARPHDTTIKEVGAQRTALAHALADITDERAQRIAALLRGRGAVDLGAVAAVLDEPDEATTDREVLLGRELADLDPPPVDEVTRLAAQLREAADEATRYDGGRPRAALRSAELLRLALEQHEDAGDGPCPVCATGALDGGWRAAAAQSVTELRQRSVAAQTAMTRRTAVLRQAHHLIDDLAVPEGPGSESSVGVLRDAVAALRRVPGEPAALADPHGRAVPGCGVGGGRGPRVRRRVPAAARHRLAGCGGRRARVGGRRRRARGAGGDPGPVEGRARVAEGGGYGDPQRADRALRRAFAADLGSATAGEQRRVGCDDAGGDQQPAAGGLPGQRGWRRQRDRAGRDESG